MVLDFLVAVCFFDLFGEEFCDFAVYRRDFFVVFARA